MPPPPSRDAVARPPGQAGGHLLEPRRHWQLLRSLRGGAPASSTRGAVACSLAALVAAAGGCRTGSLPCGHTWRRPSQGLGAWHFAGTCASRALPPTVA
eukprot:4535060-Alexandrium_andersonii.AAC.1